MKKITIMYEFLSEPGGLERVLKFQGKALSKHGFEVMYAFAFVDPKLKNYLKGFKIIEYSPSIIKNEPLQIMSSVFKPSSLKHLESSDLIIVHSFPGSTIANRLFRKKNIPYIQYIHHQPQFLYNSNIQWAKNTWKRRIAFFLGRIFGRYLRMKDKKAVKDAKEILVNSNMVRKIVGQIYGRRGVLCYPPIDPLFMKKVKNPRATLKKYGLSEDFILASGRIVNQKRFDYLIDAFSYIQKDFPKLSLVFAGKVDKKYQGFLENLAKEKGIKDIKFLGSIKLKELKNLYSKAKITVLTCPKEYFGLVPPEAIANGCPVIAWRDNSGPQETVKEGINGFLAKPYSAKDFGDKMKKALRKKWNKQKIKKSILRFSEKNIEKDFIKVVKKVL
ncbi:glycosyltransferase family 4 protein [Nanoarchaeota archaeon]